MTETSRSIVIAAPPQTIFRLAASTERWPEYLPHYRTVRVLSRNGIAKTIAMAAWRGFVPIAWVAEQTDDPERPAIFFHHVRGWTRGMDVEWRFEPVAGGTRVTIAHTLQFRFPIAAEWLGRHVVAGFFVDYVAGKTLARMKELAEAAG